MKVENFSDDAKKTIEGIKGLSYCGPNKTIIITMNLSEYTFNKVINEPSLKEYKDIIQKAYSEFKGV
ncbi:hypothetical protein ES705_36620 [subsurface metagenome]